MFSMIRWLRIHWGFDRYSAETIDRLLHSAHVGDLRWIVRVTTAGAIVAIAVIATTAYKFGPGADQKLYGILVPFQISAVLAGLGGIIAWCYQTGSARLGVVDLFACEITTLCRIWNINGLVHSCIQSFELDLGEQAQHERDEIKRMRARFERFDSPETYTPIFDADAKELRNLSVKIVTNITAFYTYWKSTRDAFRTLANVQAMIGNTLQAAGNDPWHRAMRNVIYMQFLACESARRTVRELIEFEPNSVENTITILLTELPAYHFLLQHFPKDDVRHARLELRRDRYRTVVVEIYCRTKREHRRHKDIATAKKHHPLLSEEDLDELCRDWKKAYRMLAELKKSYKAAIGKPLARRKKSDPVG